MDQRENEILEQYGKALVALVVHRDWVDPKDRAVAATSFAIEVEGEWMLVTAEHVLDDLEKQHALNPETRAFWRASVDTMPDATPFVFEPEKAISAKWLANLRIDGPDLEEQDRIAVDFILSLDAGIYSLSPLMRDNMQRAGVVPLTRKDLWGENPDLLEDVKAGRASYWIGGYPATRVVREPDGHLTQINHVWLPIWPKEMLPPILKLVPAWPDGTFDHDVRGMSGGPALVVGQGRVGWFGVQSSQHRHAGKIKQLDIADGVTFFEIIELVVKALRAQRNTE